MFWRLGFISAWRNRARSVLAIIAMALAAGFMTNAISLSRGYASGHSIGYRTLSGGEIAAYSLPLNASTTMEQNQWHYAELNGVENTDLNIMLPELLKNGYLTDQEVRLAFTDDLIASIASFPGVSYVYPRYQIPALSSGKTGVWNTPLRGRIAILDQFLPISEFIYDGRWLLPQDEGELVCVVSTEQHYPSGQRMYGLGDTVHLIVPRILPGSFAAPYYDFSDPILYELKVIGLLDISARFLMHGPAGMQLFLQSDEIQLPWETWSRIWQGAGGEVYLPQQLALKVEDLSYLEDIVLDLQTEYPAYSFFSVSQLAQRAQSSFLFEQVAKVPHISFFHESIIKESYDEQPVMALDLRLPLVVLIFINAALVIASNLLIMVSERRNEIGILKAVGSTRFEVVQMVLSEALLISLFGSLIGFTIFRVPAFMNQMTNSVIPALLARDVLRDLAMVLTIATVSSLLFGMLPALTMANLSVREVLQTE